MTQFLYGALCGVLFGWFSGAIGAAYVIARGKSDAFTRNRDEEPTATIISDGIERELRLTRQIC